VSQPVREHPRPHRCRCLLISRLGIHDPCRVWVESPDQPFCENCEAKHQTAAWAEAFRYRGGTVTVWTE
jgi:DNA polymerase III psi subunit